MYSPPLRHSKISKTEIFLVFDESKYYVITILAVACFVCFQFRVLKVVVMYDFDYDDGQQIVECRQS